MLDTMLDMMLVARTYEANLVKTANLVKMANLVKTADDVKIDIVEMLDMLVAQSYSARTYSARTYDVKMADLFLVIHIIFIKMTMAKAKNFAVYIGKAQNHTKMAKVSKSTKQNKTKQTPFLRVRNFEAQNFKAQNFTVNIGKTIK